VPLSGPVAEFYRAVMEALGGLGVSVRVSELPSEVPDPIPFPLDREHHVYDGEQAHRFWMVLTRVDVVMKRHRARFRGKTSPVHFFWGSFDLANTRFSGRPAPDRPNADPITKESYSHEVISHGFWLGSGVIQEPAFYAYAAPEPPGFNRARVKPSAAFYSKDMSEFILP